MRNEWHSLERPWRAGGRVSRNLLHPLHKIREELHGVLGCGERDHKSSDHNVSKDIWLPAVITTSGT
jgi:hypothetical protein